jgi:hypothetical protein
MRRKRPFHVVLGAMRDELGLGVFIDSQFHLHYALPNFSECCLPVLQRACMGGSKNMPALADCELLAINCAPPDEIPDKPEKGAL